MKNIFSKYSYIALLLVVVALFVLLFYPGFILGEEHNSKYSYHDISDRTNHNWGNQRHDNQRNRPECPDNSSYNRFRGRCECNEGYKVKGNECVDPYNYCSNKYGSDVTYSPDKNQCICESGYRFRGECLAADTICQRQYGENVEYNARNNSCQCKQGYIPSRQGSSCVEADSFCQDRYGQKSRYNTRRGSCECKREFFLSRERDKCVSRDRICKDRLGSDAEFDDNKQSCTCTGDHILNQRGNQCIDTEDYCENKYGNLKNVKPLLFRELQDFKCRAYFEVSSFF